MESYPQGVILVEWRVAGPIGQGQHGVEMESAKSHHGHGERRARDVIRHGITGERAPR